MASTSDDSGKQVSTASQTSDSAPAESDMGTRDAQLADGDGPDSTKHDGPDAPGTATGGGGSDAGPTAGPADRQV